MEPDQKSGDRETDDRVVRAAGRIVEYSREIYRLESVTDVTNRTLEAAPTIIEGSPAPAVVEIRRDDDLRVLGERTARSTESEPDSLARTAYENRTVTIRAPAETELACDEDVLFVDATADSEGSHTEVTIAVPTVYTDKMGDSGVILLLSWDRLNQIEEYHVCPAEYLAEHVATAISTIRSRERLERARNDLSKRKEMIEVYDRLLRHDLGNDLQVITGFAEAIAAMTDEDGVTEYAGKIQRTAEGAAELIGDVGDTVTLLEEEKNQPEARELEPILSAAVADVEAKFDELTVEYDPDAFDYEVYTGELIDSVFTNILSNAAIHNDESVTVDLATETPTPGTVVVEIVDDGQGIADELSGEIFKMGRKGPDSDGTGFGLSLARTLVESYGGELNVRESDRGGATFRITLERA